MAETGSKRSVRQSRVVTIMVVPHSAQQPWSLRIPKIAIELTFALIGLAGICLLAFTNSYQRMTSHMEELQQLRQTAREQREQIDSLAQKAAEVHQSLLELELLEQQVRKMLDLPSPERSEQGVESAVEPETSADPRPGARIAQLQGPQSSRGEARRLLADEPTAHHLMTSAVVAAVGGPTHLADANTQLGTTNLGGLANLQSPQFEPTGVETADAASVELTQAQAASLELLNRMQTLRTEAADKLAYLAAKPSRRPVSGPITSYFGVRQNPFGWGTEFHAGIDFGAPYGDPIVATGTGVVTFAGWDSGYGNKVTIDHGYGLVTVYAHASKLLVDVGDEVEAGDVIALVGSSGRSTAAHLHYEVWVNGRLTDPWDYLP